MDEEQLPLFNTTGSGPAHSRKRPPVSEQAEHLRRVSDRIAAHVLAFVDARGLGGRFHLTDLVAWVVTEMGNEAVAPDSPSRILRMLRRRGVLRYKVVSRRESLYEVTAIEGAGSSESNGDA